MNLFQHYMGGYGPMTDDGSMRPKPWMQAGFQAHTGGPGQMQQGGMEHMPQMHAYTGGGLPAMAQGFPSAQTGGPGQMMPAMNVGTGGYDAPQQFSANTGGPMQPQPVGPPQAYTGGGFQPQQTGNQGGNGLARMFRGFSPYGRPQMY